MGEMGDNTLTIFGFGAWCHTWGISLKHIQALISERAFT